MNESVNSVLKVIKDHLKDRNITLTEMAKKLDSNHASLSRLLNGHSRLTIEDLSGFSGALGIPMSALLKEAETRDGKVRISEESERYICSDPRRYITFMVLNDPTTVEDVVTRFRLKKEFVIETITAFINDGIAFQPGAGLYQLTDMGKDIAFGRTLEFYTIKSKLYGIQAKDTYQNLSRDPAYWDERDDQLRIARLTPSQTLAITKQIETLNSQIRTMDDMNDRPKADGSRDSNTKLNMVFLAVKPIDDRILNL